MSTEAGRTEAQQIQEEAAQLTPINLVIKVIRAIILRIKGNG